jgi:hypothetical protein
MTEQLPAGRRIYPDVAAMNTAAELSPTFSSGHLAATLDPPALYIRNEGQWVPLASVAGNIPAPTVVNASETAAGIAELATTEETNAGTDTFRIVTPARLSGRTATEERSGVVELATAAETQAGTDGTRAIHPAGMKTAMTPEAWITPTLTNGWVNFGAPRENLSFRKTVTGDVVIRGSVKNGATGTVVFTLPVGYRPANERQFPTVAGGQLGSVVVSSTGTVALTLGAGSSANVTVEVRFDA